jgi:Cu-processing system ATP-binding protein
MNVVEIRAVHQRYGRMEVLHGLDLDLAEGEVLGLFGHNGAGKTTSMKLVLGLLQPSQGEVRVLGQSPRHNGIRRQFGYLPENVTFYPHLTGRETLCHFARLKGAPAPQVDDLLDQVGLTHAADRRVKTYSKGMRQRLGLAQAILGAPRLLLLDEPTVGLDPIATADFYRLIDRMRHQGTSVILCSHVLPGVEAHIDRAAILASGHLQAVGSLTELRHTAGLPVRIRADAVRQADALARELRAAGHEVLLRDGGGLEIHAQPIDKMGVLQRLLQIGQPGELDIHQPSLEDLYRYYMKQASSEMEPAL